MDPSVSEKTAVKPEMFKPAKKYHRIRQAVQIIALVLFLYLLIGTQREIVTLLPHDLFFIADPLVGISAMLASRTWLVLMAIGGAIVLILTLIFGRVWCSWLCPMGTVIDWIPSRHPKLKKLDIPAFWRQGKNMLFFTIIIGAIFGSLTLIFLDPITLLFRSIAGVILPFLSWLFEIIESWLYHIGPVQSAVSWFDVNVRLALIGEPSFFLPNILLAVVLVAVLVLNAIRQRFWCRYLCPLGGLLGIVSRLSRIRYKVNDDKCISCGRCAVICPTGAINPEKKYTASTAECTTCLECAENCPTRAISFPAQSGISTVKRYEPERRQFLASLGIAAVGAVILRSIPLISKQKPDVIVPPGTDNKRLQNQCIRCGECIKVCPTGAIQPSASVNNWDNLWTPFLVMRHGYCDYSCNACGEVCPTGAIQKLTLEEKRKQILGIAVIDRNRCIPWAEGRECIVCEEMCPLPEKAIWLGGGGGGRGGRSGENGALKPHVNEDLCIGCGICEHQCPVNGQAAIRIFVSSEELG